MKKYTFNIPQVLLTVIITEVVLAVIVLAFYFFQNDLFQAFSIDQQRFRFEHVNVLWGLLALPIFSVLVLFYLNWKNRKIKLYASEDLLPELTVPVSQSKTNIKYILSRVALVFLLIALAGPQYGTSQKETKIKGIDIVLALDVSKSMNAVDKGSSMDRLSEAKLAIERLVKKLNGDRIGLIVFAGDAIVQLPLTNDYYAAKSFLKILDTDAVPTSGTSISSAINLATTSFQEDAETSKALILITDGEDHEEGAIEAAKLAAEKGIIINTIGLGSVEGVPIPNVNRYGQVSGYRKDAEGNIVVSKLNEEVLKDIAAQANGVYIKADKTRLGLDYLLDNLKKLEKKEINTVSYQDYEEQYQFFLAIGLFLLVLESFITDKESLYFNNLKLFE